MPPNPLRLKLFVLVAEGSCTPLDSSKGLKEQGVLSKTTLRLMKKTDIYNSVEHDLEELSDELEEGKKDAKKAIDLMVRLAKSLPRSFDTMVVSQHLRSIKKCFD